MYNASIRALCVVVFSAMALSCASIPAGVSPAVGRYELRTVNGRAVPVDGLGGALAGEMRLDADGRATRVVQYASSGVPGPIVIRSSGRYRVRGTQLTLTLANEGRGALSTRWQASGDLQLPALVLRYPGPADRIVEERYVKVSP